MTPQEQAIYEADCAKYGPLPLPVRWRKPKLLPGQTDPWGRTWIPEYPDGTFPRPTTQPDESQGQPQH